VTTTIDPVTVRRSDELLARSLVYRLCSQALTYPTPEVVAALRDDDVPVALAAAEALPPGPRAALELAAAAFAAAEPAELEGRYRALFSHVHSQDHPQYETDVTAADVWRQTNELADLAGFYLAFGVRGSGERQDHVAVELEFLHAVLYKAAWATAQGEEDRATICLAAVDAFLTDHVLRWVHDLGERLRHRRVAPYAETGALVSAVLAWEAERLGVRLDGPAAARSRVGVDLGLEVKGLCEG
jgi:nitrate reductase assembly molybdenum cofactor insertion protein NarJ